MAKKQTKKTIVGSSKLKSSQKKWLQLKFVIPIVTAVALVGGFLVYRSHAVSDPDWNCSTCAVSSQTPYSASYWTITNEWQNFQNSAFDAYPTLHYRLCFGARNYNASDTYVVTGPTEYFKDLLQIVPAHTTKWRTYCSLPYQPPKGTVRITPKLRVYKGPRLQVNWVFVQSAYY